jgi:hypothetical protein
MRRINRGATVRGLVSLMALAPLTACDGIGQPPFSPCERAEPELVFRKTDSAGVSFRVTGCEAARAPLDWVVDPEPALELGRGSDMEQQFHQIRGVLSLPGGRLVVLDRGTRQLRFFDSQGQLLHTRGGKGVGPGEFQTPYLIATSTDDRVVVWDQRTRRFTSYPADGSGDPPELSDGTWIPVHSMPLGVAGDQILVRRAVDDYSEFGLLEQDVTILWDRGKEGGQVLHRDRVPWLYRVKVPGQMYGYTPPFERSPTATLTRTGAALTTGKHFEVLEFDTAGALTGILRVDRMREPVLPSIFEEYVEMQIQQDRGSAEFWSHLTDVPLPDSMPAFTQILIDDLDWTWAKISEWDARIAQPWMVFDPEGRGRGIIELPPGLQVRHIGSDFILGTSETSLGVEIVRRYTLRRTHEP